LSEAAIKLLKAQIKIEGNDLIFPSTMKGTKMSDNTLGEVMLRLGIPKSLAVPHGFRSTFKDWAIEETNYPPEMSEIALSHQVGSKVEMAYRRGDMLAKRRQQMDDWATFCSTPYVEPEVRGAKVIDLHARTA
jgi:integrase